MRCVFFYLAPISIFGPFMAHKDEKIILLNYKFGTWKIRKRQHKLFQGFPKLLRFVLLRGPGAKPMVRREAERSEADRLVVYSHTIRYTTNFCEHTVVQIKDEVFRSGKFYFTAGMSNFTLVRSNRNVKSGRK